jgi:hypothetical protein
VWTSQVAEPFGALTPPLAAVLLEEARDLCGGLVGSTGQWMREPSEKSSELLLKIAERKARLCGLDRQEGGLVATVTAEQIAAFFGWDPQEPVQDVEAEELQYEAPGLRDGNGGAA